jgi:quinol monooxygenase YgiN
MSVMMIVSFQAADGKAEALRPLLQQGRDFSRKAKGCEAFDQYQDQDEPDQFVMVQRWISAAAHHAHFENNVKGSGHLDKILPLLAKPIASGVYRGVIQPMIR